MGPGCVVVGSPRRPVGQAGRIAVPPTRSRRLDRAFKATIVASTAPRPRGCPGDAVGPPMASARSIFDHARSVASMLGLPVSTGPSSRPQRDRDRTAGGRAAREFLEQVARDRGPTMREFLRVARMDRDSAVIRWGNFDWTLALSSAVFEPDDTGRSYRLLPEHPIDLADQPDDRQGPGDVRDPRHARGPAARRGGRRAGRPGVGPDDQLVGLPGARARPDRPGPRHRPGRLEHAGPARRRRPDARRSGSKPTLRARPRRPRLGPEHGAPRLLARAILSHA